jgi:hypothetical protein
MKIISLCVLGIALVAALGSAPSQAQTVVGYGSWVEAQTAGNCPSYCTGNEFSSTASGGPGQLTAAAQNQVYAQAFGSVSFDPTNHLLPELKAFARAPAGKQGQTTSFAVQRYGYSGAETKFVNLIVNLSGRIALPLNGLADNRLVGSLAIVRGDTLPWDPNFATLIYERVPAADVLAQAGLAWVNPGNGSVRTDLSFEVQTGDSFFVVASFWAIGQNGTADGSSTLKMIFEDATGLNAVSSVPELGTAWMATAGLLALAFGARRRRAA